MTRPLSELLGRVGRPVIRALAHTWRIEAVRQDRWNGALEGSAPYLLLSWHEALLPVLWHHRRRGIAAVVSPARDGRHLAGLAGSLGYTVIAGSSHRSATRALLGAVRALRRGTPVGMTPDGPRGPRRVLKPGAIAAAQRTGATIVPVHAEARRGWRARSWDQFLIPQPFARVRVAYGEPFKVDAGPLGRDAAIQRAVQGLAEAARLAQCPDDAATPID